MPAPSFVGVGTQASGTTGTVNYGYHASTVAGDTMLTCIESADTTGAVNSSMGWTSAPNSPRAQGSNVVSVSVFHRVFVSLEAGFMAGAAANHQTGTIVSYRGAGAIASTAAASNNGTAVTSGTVTTTVDDCRVVLVAVYAADTATAQFSSVANASLTGVTVRYQAGTTNGNGGGVLIADGVKSAAGSVNAWTATLAASQAWAALVIVLPPSAASTTHEGAGMTSAIADSMAAAFALAGASGATPATTAAAASATSLTGSASTAAASSSSRGSATSRATSASSTATTTAAIGSATTRTSGSGLNPASSSAFGAAGTLVGAVMHAAASVTSVVSTVFGQASLRAASFSLTAASSTTTGQAAARHGVAGTTTAVAASIGRGSIRTRASALVTAIGSLFGAGSSAEPTGTTPPSRMPPVPAENRIGVVGLNRRTAGIPREPRLPIVPPDTRMEA